MIAALAKSIAIRQDFPICCLLTDYSRNSSKRLALLLKAICYCWTDESERVCAVSFYIVLISFCLTLSLRAEVAFGDLQLTPNDANEKESRRRIYLELHLQLHQ